MDPIRRFERPALRSPRAVMAFEGWNDAADAASGAAAFLLGQADPAPFAVVEPEEFYDFQVQRPEVAIDEGGTRRITWPETRAIALELPGQAHDLVVVSGPEPSYRWKTYTRHLTALLSEADIDLVITLGAFIGQVAHTLPVPVFGVATDPALLQRHDLPGSTYQGPTGIVGVMLEACREVGIPGVSLWAGIPHYLAANPNPAAMLALLDHAASIAGVAVDTAELRMAADEFRSKVDAALEQNEGFAEYVERLETGLDVEPMDSPAAGDLLVTEIEDFLRYRD